jgi:hypothetical protein
MSHEIIQKRPEPHDAIHDLESFWWILVHLALTREGPGKRRRVASGSPLQDTLINYFDNYHELVQFKQGIFGRSIEKAQGTMEVDLLAHFDNYFAPIKPLVRQWWAILRLGFQFQGYERANVHEFILKLLREQIDSMDDSELETALSRREADRRERYHEETAQAIRHQKCAQFYPKTPPAKEKQSATPNPPPNTPGSPTLARAMKHRRLEKN